jgi:hypothetical protein
MVRRLINEDFVKSNTVKLGKYFDVGGGESELKYRVLGDYNLGWSSALAHAPRGLKLYETAPRRSSAGPYFPTPDSY